MRVLVADDERAAAEALATFLERRGHAPVTALDGEQAWRLAQEQPFLLSPPPHAVQLTLAVGVEHQLRRVR